MANLYYFVLIIGIVSTTIGLIIFILIIKFLHDNRVKNMITALIFLGGGIGIIVILIAFIPSPQFQREYIFKMLHLNEEQLELLTIYDRNNIKGSLIEINEKQLLEEWMFILQSCQSFRPNHPSYEKKYMIILEKKDGDKYLYQVAIDKKTVDTADLQLLKRSELGTGFLNFGSYRCDGLFEFISKKAPDASLIMPK